MNSPHSPDDALSSAPLGREVRYPSSYDAGQLHPIPREPQRRTLPVRCAWHGADVWNAYELSWLDPRGKPIVATGRFTFPASSIHLVESKSLKLYLNSFNQSRFASMDAVRQCMTRDLSETAGVPVEVVLDSRRSGPDLVIAPLEGECLDGLDVEIDVYEPSPDQLACRPGAAVVTETLCSDLLKSNCPVTGQPDWGSVQIRYRGRAIDRAGLLAYIVSFRQHEGFHEHCVERMYTDLWTRCRPESLFVHARYTRRGGLDINPWRSSDPATVGHTRTVRQ